MRMTSGARCRTIARALVGVVRGADAVEVGLGRQREHHEVGEGAVVVDDQHARRSVRSPPASSYV